MGRDELFRRGRQGSQEGGDTLYDNGVHGTPTEDR